MKIGKKNNNDYQFWAEPKWDDDRFELSHQIDSWCLKHFGNCNWSHSDLGCLDWVAENRVYYFKYEKDRNWFALRWL